MKLKYKKMILLTTMSTMGIGMLTLSLSHDQPKAQESSKIEEVSTLRSMEDATQTPEKQDVSTQDIVEPTQPLIPTATPTPSPIPTPTPIPVYGFEELEKMDDLLKEYYNAKAARDIGKIRSLCSDPTQASSLEDLEKIVKYIEEYKNIKSYAKKSYEPGAYIVYVYYDIKFARINTLAPSLSKLYVITNDEGYFRIYSETMSPELRDYYNARNGDEDVIALIKMTDEKADKAKAQDEDLMIFWTGLDELTQSNSEDNDAQAQGDAASGE